jgi:hypothetical protein
VTVLMSRIWVTVRPNLRSRVKIEVTKREPVETEELVVKRKDNGY